ncbi:hypothetical protein [Metabacillus bambusae]|uniref:Uncharacterized protein n=1 Tax=Metabacillus bambusae TaxID=2795218 RepID=A0ABS3NBM3_9BACI|nr:hypothetical protein [Metabacillus bambusae]MBO1515670.1 hypothetical protein [Metabacillus bambusae]
MTSNKTDRIVVALENIVKELRINNEITAKQVKYNEYLLLRERFIRKVGDANVAIFIPKRYTKKLIYGFFIGMGAMGKLAGL